MHAILIGEVSLFILFKNRISLQQARTVATELVRVSILWHELWHEGIEEASRCWFTVSTFSVYFLFNYLSIFYILTVFCVLKIVRIY